jgi:hypothetical protein
VARNTRAVGGYLNKDLSNRPDVSPWVTDRTAKGRLGMNTGGGIFSYTPERIAELAQGRKKPGVLLFGDHCFSLTRLCTASRRIK